MSTLNGQPDSHDRSQRVESNLAEYWVELASHPPGEVHATEQLCWTYTGTEHFNRVVSANLSDDQVRRVARRIRASFRRRRAAVAWLVGPSTVPHDIGSVLQRHGFSSYGRWTGMTHDLRSLDVIPFPRMMPEIRQVDSVESLRDWVRVIARSFDMPRQASAFLYGHFLEQLSEPDSPWIHNLAYLDGKAVASSTVFARDGVAGIYLVATTPDSRHNGIGTQMTYVALNQARSLDTDMAVLHATSEGRGIYERLGFQACCEIDIYRLGPPRSLVRRIGGRIINQIERRALSG